MIELQDLVRTVRRATSYVDVFSSTTADQASASVAQQYRSYAKVLHPDRYSNDQDKQQASEGFVLLGILKSQADEAIRMHRFGDRFSLVTITTRRHRYILDSPMATGDICATYRGETTDDGVKKLLFCKIAKSPGDRDLLQNEAAALKRLHRDEAEDKWKRHMPELLESFVYDDGVRRQANALSLLEGFYTLDAVKRAFAAGLDPRHAVWMFRRLLMALGFAHDNNVVHGAVVPTHVMIMPELHGLVLADWCYASVGAKDEPYPTIKAVVRPYRQWYPEEVLAKQAPTAATDIAMAVRCIIDVMGGNPLTGQLPLTIPRPLRAYLKGCLQTKQSMRPQNAWLLLEEFDELLKTIGAPFYPRRFVPFTMPHGVV